MNQSSSAACSTQGLQVCTVKRGLQSSQSSSGLLQACGFELDLEEGPEGSDGNAFAVLPEDADLQQLKAAVSLLGGILSGQTQKAGSGEQAVI